MGAGRFENKHGVGILLNRKWRKAIYWTAYIRDRAIATSITVNGQRVLLMSEVFTSPTRGMLAIMSKKAYRAIEKHTKSVRESW